MLALPRGRLAGVFAKVCILIDSNAFVYQSYDTLRHPRRRAGAGVHSVQSGGRGGGGGGGGGPGGGGGGGGGPGDVRCLQMVYMPPSSRSTAALTLPPVAVSARTLDSVSKKPMSQSWVGLGLG